MELVSKVIYHASGFSLNPGDSTIGLDISEELKRSILEDHPEWFEVCGAPAVKEKVVEDLETPEDALTVETPEAKMGKTRKK